KLIVVIVLVPVILPLDDTNANNRIVHLAEGLVKPLVGALIRELLHINHLERTVKDIQSRFVRELRHVRSPIRLKDLTRSYVAPLQSNTTAELWFAHWDGMQLSPAI